MRMGYSRTDTINSSFTGRSEGKDRDRRGDLSQSLEGLLGWLDTVSSKGEYVENLDYLLTLRETSGKRIIQQLKGSRAG